MPDPRLKARLMLRWQEEELAAVRHVAAKESLSVSEYVRKVTMEAVARTPYQPTIAIVEPGGDL